MNYLGESILDMSTGTVGPVGPQGPQGPQGPTGPAGPGQVPVWAQLMYSSPSDTPLTTSGQLSTITYNRLLPPIVTVIEPFFVQFNGINVIDNTSFEVPSTGQYRIRYKLGLKSDVALQNIYIALRINNVNVAPSIQVAKVGNVNITYIDAEFCVTTFRPNETVYLFARAETTQTAIQTSYLSFNVTSF